MNQRDDLGPLLSMWLPLVFLLVQIMARLLDAADEFYFTYFETEAGLVETSTAAVLLPAAFFAARLGRQLNREVSSLCGWWYLCVAALCLVFFGEEVSWGQHWFGFDSPCFSKRTTAKERPICTI